MKISYEDIDQSMRNAVALTSKSRWLKTSESCSGAKGEGRHKKKSEPSVFMSYETAHLDRFMSLLGKAMTKYRDGWKTVIGNRWILEAAGPRVTIMTDKIYRKTIFVSFRVTTEEARQTAIKILEQVGRLASCA